MRITSNDLVINTNGVDFKALLDDWRWLVDESYTPVVISAFGDLFLEGKDGAMYRLDTGMGRVSKVANSREEFRSLMTKPDNAGEWFMPTLVLELKSRGRTLGPGECYSYKVPPILGGNVEVANFETTDLQVHFSVLGQIHHKVKDLPDGTSIRDIKVSEPDRADASR